MSERIWWILNRPFGIDKNYNLRFGENGEKKLVPFEPIPYKDLCLGVIDNSTLKPERLMLFDKDRREILLNNPDTNQLTRLILPGKSAVLVLTPDVCNREFVKDVVLTTLGKNHASGRHIHVATVAEIEDAGWVPYYAPLQMEGLPDHVRLVAKRTIATQGKEDPTITDAQSLVNALIKIC